MDEVRSRAKVETGVRLGILVAHRPDGTLEVLIDGREPDLAVPARTTVPLGAEDIGAEVALLFEHGDADRPLIVGRVRRGDEAEALTRLEVTSDGRRRVVVGATDELVLECGKASITLTRAGKVLIRGAYVSSRSSGANRIRGGSVHLN